MSDMDIQFGELEHAQPDPRLRPDRNKQFAVAALQSPIEDELPIFVDMDVMRDMELHAQSDTSVELGGVLLGGQYEDQDGRPFVVVTDSLRAQHYEATKGSFKFTHETWEEITRQRDDFPDDLQMVGWYHTHPDWGVFLSGMDMFICDHFFNKPLDVALVIDPCRGDRGMFQWTGDPGERVRRTGGFYLTASRFRQNELEIFASQLEGKLTMSNDPRYGGFSNPTINVPPPVVHVPQSQSAWQSLAVLGMLAMQFFFVALIAWRLLQPAASNEKQQDKSQQQIVQLEKKIDRLIEARRTESLVDAKLEVLDQVIKGENGQPGQVNKLVQQRQEIDKLEDDLATYRAAGKQRDQDIRRLDHQLQQAQNDAKLKLQDMQRQLTETQTALKKVSKERDDYKSRAGKSGKKDDKAGSEQAGGWISGKKFLLYAAVGLAAALLIGGVAAGIAMRKSDHSSDEDQPDEESDTTFIGETENEEDQS